MTESFSANIKTHFPNQKAWLIVAIAMVVGTAYALALFYTLHPIAVDWRVIFYLISKIPFAPYSFFEFVYLPWIALVLYPFSFFSEHVSLLLNLSICTIVFILLVLYKKGNLLSVALTLTSAPFLSLLINANIDWIPALGLFFQNGVGVIFLFAKPQVGFLAALDWYLKEKEKLWFVLVPLIFMLLSFLIWPSWPFEMLANIQESKLAGKPNASLFPWTLPLGIFLVIYIMWKRPENGEILGALATLCVFPYYAYHSITLTFALVSAKYPRLALAVWAVLWVLKIIQNWAALSQVFGAVF